MSADIAGVIRAAAYSAYDLSLGGADSRAYAWFKQVEPGHLVIETSTVFMAKHSHDAVGRLLRVEREPRPGDWGAEDPPTERVWYIERLDGTECRWTNADFVRVPESICPWRLNQDAH